MSRFPEPPPEHLYAELQRLQEELLLRDQLIQQLSRELYNELDHQIDPVVAAPQLAVDPATVSEESAKLAADYRALQARNQQLERQLLQLPQIYQAKFEDRLQPLQARLQFLEAENQRLQAQINQNYPLLPEPPARQPVQLPLRNYVPDYSELQ